LDDDGLESALRRHVDGLAGKFNVRIESRLRDEPPGDLGLALFRISQEALANIRKHAKADVVSIVLEERNDGYVVCIQDDGVGFSPPEVLQSAPGHLGLSSMRERAEMWSGWCRVQSLPDAGTTVEVWLPRSPRDGSGDDGIPAPNGGAPSPRSGGLTAVPPPVRHRDEADEAFGEALPPRRAAFGG
jgi:nitrate/nitrite-specific signal transduction histidine kinase